MTHYEFRPVGKKGRNKYVGRWTEPTPRRIDLPFNVESMKLLLKCGGEPDRSPYTHQEIAHWCDQFNMNFFCHDTDHAMDLANNVAEDVYMQWDMYLANTYSLEELKKMDFSLVQVPVKWFRGWLEQLKGN